MLLGQRFVPRLAIASYVGGDERGAEVEPVLYRVSARPASSALSV